jgi:hypothetical protein
MKTPDKNNLQVVPSHIVKVISYLLVFQYVFFINILFSIIIKPGTLGYFRRSHKKDSLWRKADLAKQFESKYVFPVEEIKSKAESSKKANAGKLIQIIEDLENFNLADTVDQYFAKNGLTKSITLKLSNELASVQTAKLSTLKTILQKDLLLSKESKK